MATSCRHSSDTRGASASVGGRLLLAAILAAAGPSAAIGQTPSPTSSPSESQGASQGDGATNRPQTPANPIVLASPAPIGDNDPINTPIGSEAATLDQEPDLDEIPVVKITIPERMNFQLAAWNIAALKPGEEEAGQTQADPSAATSWRHTFGAERKTSLWRKRGPAGFTADIIALQGVRSLRDVRRMFHARHYHAVVSRQLLARSTPTTGGLAIFRSNAPATTAVVFRRRRGVRVAGFRHFLPSPSPKSEEQPAITALRLRVYGKLIWIASLDTPPRCVSQAKVATGQRKDPRAATCNLAPTMIPALTAWLKDIASRGRPLVLLGRWPQELTDMLQGAGYANTRPATVTTTCRPAALSLAVASRVSDTAGAASADQPVPAKGNPCVLRAMLTMRLR